MGRSGQNCICEEKQNTEFVIQVSACVGGWLVYVHSCTRVLNTFFFFGGDRKTYIYILFHRSNSVEQLLEKNYRIHCSVHGIVSKLASAGSPAPSESITG